MASAPCRRRIRVALACALLGSVTSLFEASDASASGVVWPNMVERVAEDLGSRDVERRRAAALQLVRLPRSRVRALITKALQDSDERVRVSAARAAVVASDESSVEIVSTWLSDKDVNLRRAAVEVLEAFPKSERAVERLARALADPQARVRLSAARALGATGDASATSALLSRIDDPNPNVSVAIVDALEALSDPRSVVPLIGRLSDNRVATRRAAARALGTLGGQAAVSALLLALRDTDAQVRLSVVAALGVTGADDATASLRTVVTDDADVDVRVAALHALASIGSEVATEALIDALGSSRDEVSSEARVALGELPMERAELLRRCLQGAPASIAKADGCAEALASHPSDGNFETLARAWRDRTISSETALTALGTVGDPRGIPTVLEQLSAEEAPVRLAAVTAAMSLLDPAKPDGRAVEPIVRALNAPQRATEERIALLLLLGRTGAPRASAHLAPFVAEHNPLRVRLAALHALKDVGVGSAALDVVLAAVSAPESSLRLEAARALRGCRCGEALSPLLSLLTASAGQDRQAVASALIGPLSTFGKAEHVAQLQTLARGAERGVVAALIEALAVVASPEATSALLSLTTEGREPRAKVAEVLAFHGQRLAESHRRTVVDALEGMAAEADPVVRANAVWALGELADARSVALIGEAMGDPDTAVAANAVAAWGKLPKTDASAARLCEALSDSRAYVRSNALVGLRGWAERCKAGLELGLLQFDNSDVVRVAAAHLVRDVPDTRRSAEEAKVLQHCARSEPSGRVAAACSTRPATVTAEESAPPQRPLPATLFIVPAGQSSPKSGAPYALSRGDAAPIRLGLADGRGAVMLGALPGDTLSLEAPAGTDTP